MNTQAIRLRVSREESESWSHALDRGGSPYADESVTWHLGSAELSALVHDAQAARTLLDLIDTPELVDFPRAVHLEAVHQVQRWGTGDRQGKAPFDWFWLLSHLATRALEHHKEAERLVASKSGYEDEQGSAFWSLVDGQIAHHREKAAHHTITAGAALSHWHASVIGKATPMQPGHAPSAQLANEIGSAA